MKNPGHNGICPSCEKQGPVGSPCETDLCRRRGYHRVPTEDLLAAGPRPDPLIGQLWDGFLLTRALGAGGVGAVYRAIRQPVGLQAAVKVLHARQRPDSPLAARFAAESAALARLDHPNIVRLLATGVSEGRPYLAMEYIGGSRSLADQMEWGIDADSARRVLVQLVDALDSAHRVNIVHRDVKPANIMLQSTAREPCFVRLVDFGLVKFTDDGASTQVAAGTPVYMAPEQVRRAQIGPWTDWYAVGVLALELLTGRQPFRGASSDVILSRKLSGNLDPLAGFDGLPPAVRALVERTTAPDILSRPQSVDEMLRLIEAAFTDGGRAAPAAGAAATDDTVVSAPPRPVPSHLDAVGELLSPPPARRTHVVLRGAMIGISVGLIAGLAGLLWSSAPDRSADGPASAPVETPAPSPSATTAAARPLEAGETETRGDELEAERDTPTVALAWDEPVIGSEDAGVDAASPSEVVAPARRRAPAARRTAGRRTTARRPAPSSAPPRRAPADEPAKPSSALEIEEL